MFDIVEGTKSLISVKALDAQKFNKVQMLIKYFEGRTFLAEKELDSATLAIWGKKYAPYFIIHNAACHSKIGGRDLSVFKLAKGETSLDVLLPSNISTVKSAKKVKKSAKKVPPVVVTDATPKMIDPPVVNNVLEDAIARLEAAEEHEESKELLLA